MPFASIQTTRLDLISCSPEVLRHILLGDKDLSRLLEVEVPDPWSTFGHPAFVYAFEQVIRDPGSQRWWTYLPIIRARQILAGSGGYKGPPDPDGMVEIGYEIAPAFQHQGYATEMAQGLTEQALADPAVSFVQAHTLAQENASVAVLKKCGFVWKDEFEDETDGKVWRWECRPAS